MSYLYDSLKNALGGKNIKAGTIIKDWSPNEVRTIVIMRNFIFIADYIKQPKIYALDVNEVIQDLSNPNRRGSLNNLLENRQLSCLEEIYVDNALSSYKGVISLEDYVSSVFNQSSRLRYYGYINTCDAVVLQKVYSQVLIDGNMDFTIAKSIGGISYKDTNNTEWYKRYNLRPQYYTMDGEKGKLSIYFNKCEHIVGDKLQYENTRNAQLELNKTLVNMFKVDLDRLSELKLLMQFVRFCKNTSGVSKLVAGCIQEQLTVSKSIKGLSVELFTQAIKSMGIPIGTDEKELLSIYNKVGALDTSSACFSKESLRVEDGIYQLFSRLDFALLKAFSSTNDTSHWLMFMLTARGFKSLPNGKLTKALEEKGMLPCQSVDTCDTDVLVDYIYSLCGYNKNDFIEYLKSNK